MLACMSPGCQGTRAADCRAGATSGRLAPHGCLRLSSNNVGTGGTSSRPSLRANLAGGHLVRAQGGSELLAALGEATLVLVVVLVSA
jgi:hypothetical protein